MGLSQIGKAQLIGPLRCESQLLLGQGDACDMNVEVLREVDRHAAPAAADVEHALAGLQVKLGGDMAKLVLLGFLDRVRGRAEIGAGIIHAAVEEEAVELIRQVVVMRHIALRLDERVALPQRTSSAWPGAAAASGSEACGTHPG